MRGKGKKPELPCVNPGITPAYAGKSAAKSVFFAEFEDHPRLCGEKFDCLYHSLRNLGSPPPMRGKVFMRVIDSDGEGITPAYAGKSLPRFAGFIQSQDHPRLCGEKCPLHCTL